jgi:hypothetical protein
MVRAILHTVTRWLAEQDSATFFLVLMEKYLIESTTDFGSIHSIVNIFLLGRDTFTATVIKFTAILFDGFALKIDEASEIVEPDLGYSSPPKVVLGASLKLLSSSSSESSVPFESSSKTILSSGSFDSGSDIDDDD